MCLSPITIVNPRYKGKSYLEHRAHCELGKIGALPYIDYTIEVPCGHCPECLSKRRADFAFRLIYELEDCYNPVFVTLTYSDEFLPSGRNLSKDDAKAFVKYLSNHLPFKYTYYLCGEYGENYGRPHYHVCILPKADNNLDWDVFIHDAWKRGFVYVLPCNPARCAYCCKYSIKQVGMNYEGRLNPFHLFSKGLGSGFLVKYGDLIKKSGKPEFDSHPISRYYSEKLFNKDFLRIYNDKLRQERKMKDFGDFEFPDRVYSQSRFSNFYNTYEKERKKVLK